MTKINLQRPRREESRVLSLADYKARGERDKWRARRSAEREAARDVALYLQGQREERERAARAGAVFWVVMAIVTVVALGVSLWK